MKKLLVGVLVVYFFFFSVGVENVSATTESTFNVSSIIEFLGESSITIIDALNSCIGMIIEPEEPVEPPVNPPKSDALSPASVIEKVGKYYNKDADGNYNTCRDAGITNKAACYAYSQVGRSVKAGNNLLCDEFMNKVLSWVGYKKSVRDIKEAKAVFSKSGFKPGDMIMYNRKNSGFKYWSHIAIYTGNGVVHCNWGKPGSQECVYTKGTSLSGLNINGYLDLTGITH